MHDILRGVVVHDILRGGGGGHDILRGGGGGMTY